MIMRARFTANWSARVLGTKDAGVAASYVDAYKICWIG